ncbi:MAG: hypothetical protein AB7O24_23175 [Kofleriaceae bacterium]
MALFGKWFGGSAREAAPVPPDRAEIVAALLAEVRALGCEGELRVEGNYLFIDEGAGVVRHVFLGNFAAEYALATPTERHAVIARYARLTVRPVRVASSDLRTRLLPKLAVRREREQLRLRVGSDAAVTNLMTGRPIADGHLMIDLAVDDPETIRTVLPSDLAACRLTEEAAYVCALANLRARSGGQWHEIVPGLLLSPWADFWDGARLALPSLFRGLPIKGDPIVVVPNRCAVLVTGSEEPDGLAALYRATRSLMTKERPVFVSPLRLDGDHWRPIIHLVDRGTIRIAPSLMFLSSLQDTLDYGACESLVHDRLTGWGFDRVGLVGTLEAQDVLMTVTECGPGARVAIPKTDMVSFDLGHRSALVAWYKVEQMLGSDLVPLDIWPSYFELRRHPREDEVAPLETPRRARAN